MDKKYRAVFKAGGAVAFFRRGNALPFFEPMPTGWPSEFCQIESFEYMPLADNIPAPVASQQLIVYRRWEVHMKHASFVYYAERGAEFQARQWAETFLIALDGPGTTVKRSENENENETKS